MREMQDRAAGRLIHAARFHADKPVLHHVHATDAVFAAELVALRKEFNAFITPSGEMFSKVFNSGKIFQGSANLVKQIERLANRSNRTQIAFNFSPKLCFKFHFFVVSRASSRQMKNLSLWVLK